MNKKTFSALLIGGIAVLTLVSIDCSKPASEAPLKEGKEAVEANGDTAPAKRTPNIKFTDFPASKPVNLPEMEIAVDTKEHPRVLCNVDDARLFGKMRGRGTYEAMMRLAQNSWAKSKAGTTPDYPSAPAILAASAFSTANRNYLAMAVKEIDSALAPGKDFTDASSLEGVLWAALGWDILWGTMSQPDRLTIIGNARKTLDENILPFIKEGLPMGRRVISQGDVLSQDGNFVRAYCAVLMWELAIADDVEQMKRLLIASYPVLLTLQEGLASQVDNTPFEIIDGPIDDGLYLACLALERATGIPVIDRGLLRHTLDAAMELTRNGYASAGVKHFDSPESKAALMHLAKWRGELTAAERGEVDKWIVDAGYTPEALMHVFLKPVKD